MACVRLSVKAFLLAVAGGVAFSPQARAQAPAGAAAAPAAARSGTQPPAPPVVRFAPDGISLDEAMRLTLENDPNIKRQTTTLQYNQGVVQEQAGPFDYTFTSTVGYEYRVQELTEARKDDERKKRQQLVDYLNNNKAATDKARQLLPVLDNLQSTNGSAAAIQQLSTLDPSLASMIQLFDDLIAANGNNPSVANDLRQQRQNFIQQSLSDVKQTLNDQLSAYAQAQQGLTNLGPAPTDEVFYNGGFDVRLQKLFRNGVQFGPHFDGKVEGSNFKGKPRDATYGGKGLEDLFTFHAGTEVLVPLMRGRGAKAVAAGERAAMRERDAAQLALDHQASVSALATILSYWDLLAAQKNIDILQTSLAAQTRLVQTTQRLIDSGDMPRVELARAQASEARVRAQIADAQRQLTDARIALANAMGVAVTGDDATLPKAAGTFATAPATVAPVAAAVTEAVQRRKDIAAAARHEEAGRVLEEAAETNLRMRADLSADIWYTALEERTISRAIDRWVGPSTNVQLALEKPLGNNQAKGVLAQRQADTRSRAIDTSELQRQVGLNIVQASASINDALNRVRQAEASVNAYNQIVTAERVRLDNGDATLLDTLIVEQQQTEAQLALNAALREWSRLIAQLRYQTGTLVENGAVTAATVTSLPQGGGR